MVAENYIAKLQCLCQIGRYLGLCKVECQKSLLIKIFPEDLKEERILDDYEEVRLRVSEQRI
jgi:hypothetical protein